jgi:DNA-binding NarL/FixJ family response regulator
MARVSVIVIDDHPIVVAGLTAVLSESSELELIGAAATAEEALRLTAESEPDIAIMDVSLPGNVEGDLVRRCLELHPSLKILVVTVHEEPDIAERLLRAGAMGYLLKRSAAEELVRAIHILVGGGLYVDPSIAQKLLGVRLDTDLRESALSKREEAVLQLVAQGLSGKEAAQRLGISPKTVETYRARAVEKIGARNRADIVRYAIARGWLSRL